MHYSRLADAVLLSRYKDVDAILRNHARFTVNPDLRQSRKARYKPPLEERSILFMDPPDRTRLRSLVNKAFTRTAINSLEPRIREIMGGGCWMISGTRPDFIRQGYPLLHRRGSGAPGRTHRFGDAARTVRLITSAYRPTGIPLQHRAARSYNPAVRRKIVKIFGVRVKILNNKLLPLAKLVVFLL